MHEVLLVRGRRPGEWPDDPSWITGVRERLPDWRPEPFVSYVLKVHSRCDLSCDYCYMYQLADQSWRDQPTVMSERTVSQTALRIGEHATRHGLTGVEVVLHGGEPLLAGPELIGFTARMLRAAVPPTTTLELSVQTNGTELTETILEVLRAHAIGVGVSFDGHRDAHDRHRKHPSRLGSYDQVVAGIERLRGERYRHLFHGLLATIDLRNDPVSTYEALLRHQPPRMDFLLPHGNWSSPPPGRTEGASATPYADWLIAVFDRWYAATPMQTRVRLFASIMRLLLGGRSGSEAIGLDPVRFVVVETDGEIQQVDSLKSSYHGAAGTGLNVFDHPFDAALEHPAIIARQLGVEALSDTCRECPIHRICGGGLYVHRYRAGSGYRNPSVYCPDLMRLIDHIRARVGPDIWALAARAKPPAS